MSGKQVLHPYAVTLDQFRSEICSSNPRWKGELIKVDALEVYWTDRGELILVTSDEWRDYLTGKSDNLRYGRRPDMMIIDEVSYDDFLEIISPAGNQADADF